MNESNLPSRDVLTALGVAGLLGVALIHLLDAPDTMAETPYLGALYVALIVACVGLSAMLLFAGSARTWMLVAGLDAAVLAAFVLSRTTGLPGMADDIGNWAESLGLASLFVESCLLALSAAAVVTLRAAGAPRAARREHPAPRSLAGPRRGGGRAVRHTPLG